MPDKEDEGAGAARLDGKQLGLLARVPEARVINVCRKADGRRGLRGSKSRLKMSERCEADPEESHQALQANRTEIQATGGTPPQDR
jgi:hypothetical protein